MFLHGGGLSAHTWDIVCLALREEYRCYALDLRGHGDSEWSPALDYSLGAHLRDLEALLNTPKGDLAFSLWYLKESGYLIRTDSAHHTITLKGVQFAEGLKTGDAKWIDSASG